MPKHKIQQIQNVAFQVDISRNKLDIPPSQARGHLRDDCLGVAMSMRVLMRRH